MNAVWRIEPNDVPWFVSVITICRDVSLDILKAFTIATGLEGIVVDLSGFIEFIFFFFSHYTKFSID